MTENTHSIFNDWKNFLLHLLNFKENDSQVLDINDWWKIIIFLIKLPTQEKKRKMSVLNHQKFE